MSAEMAIKKRIFVIDDEEDLREIVSFQFGAKGYEVSSAGDGVEALAKLEKINPDLIILDLNMPRMGGIEFYQKICDAQGHPSYPVLILTARANTRQLFLDFEVDGFMTKPFEISDLIREAEVIIKKKIEKEENTSSYIQTKARHVFVADPDPDALAKISGALLAAGFKVSVSTSGGQAIEKMYAEAPDVAFIHLGLADVPGDIVIQRLTRLAKTMRTRCVLYLDRNGSHDKTIMEKFSQKIGVMRCLEYDGPQQLLEILKSL